LEPSDESKPVVILIVEDEMIVRMSTTDILQDAGYLILEARDGVEAIAMIELRDANMRPSLADETGERVRRASAQREVGAARGRSLSREAVQAQAAPAGDPSGVAPRSVQQWRSGAFPRCSPARCTAQAASPKLCQSLRSSCAEWSRPFM